MAVKFENKFLIPILREVVQARGGMKHKSMYGYLCFVLKVIPNSNRGTQWNCPTGHTYAYERIKKNKQVMDVKFENKYLTPILRQVVQSRRGITHKYMYGYLCFVLKVTPNSNLVNICTEMFLLYTLMHTNGLKKKASSGC